MITQAFAGANLGLTVPLQAIAAAQQPQVPQPLSGGEGALGVVVGGLVLLSLAALGIRIYSSYYVGKKFDAPGTGALAGTFLGPAGLGLVAHFSEQ